MNLIDAPLLELRDIHAAPSPSWWPPAPGWWLLILVVLLALFWLTKQMLKRRRQRHKLQAVLQVLEQLRSDYQNDGAAFAGQLSILLRRVALEHVPRQQVAGLYAQDWLAFLDHSDGADRFRQGAGRVLADAPYQSKAVVDNDALYQLARDWLSRNL